MPARYVVATGPHVPASSPDVLTVVLGVAAVAAVLLALAVLTGDGLRAWRARRQAQKAPTGPVIESHGFYQRIPPGVLTTRLDDVAGIAEAKREVGELIDFLRDPAKYQRLGAHIPRGFLLHGPPGTGKTLLAKAVSVEADTPFFHAAGSSFVDTYVGVGAKRLRDLFAAIRKTTGPAILFIDEIDALAGQRGGSHQGEHDQTLNQLLVEMDGLETAAHPHPIIVMGATNRADMLDAAVLRPGRFDRQIAVDLPDAEGRRRILDVHLAPKPLDAEVDLDALAHRTIGLSGADLENLANEAAIYAARQDHDSITPEDVAYAMDRQIAGLASHRTVHPDDLRRVAYHEAGHALLSWLGGRVAIHTISIVPHGRALGYTVPMPHEERYLMPADALWHRLLGLLGGRAAELVAFGCASTGASDDFEKATTLVQDMIQRYALTDWGLTTTDRWKADTLHEPISRILEQGMAAACAAVERFREDLGTMAEVLLAEEVIHEDAVERYWAHLPLDALPPFPAGNAWTHYVAGETGGSHVR